MVLPSTKLVGRVLKRKHKHMIWHIILKNARTAGTSATKNLTRQPIMTTFQGEGSMIRYGEQNEIIYQRDTTP